MTGSSRLEPARKKGEPVFPKRRTTTESHRSPSGAGRPWQILALAAVLGLAAIGSAKAQIPMEGRFVAEARCPALKSIRNPSNPGTVSTEPGVSYPLLGRNADEASHYLLLIEGAEPERRWVAIGCGRIATLEDRTAAAPQTDERGIGALAAALGGMPGAATPARPVPRRGADARGETASRSEGTGQGAQRSGPGTYVLAASWHAAFCEGAGQRRECRDGGVDDRFTLHGLWPQARDYCGSAAALEGRPWGALPEPELSPATRRALDAVMPGASANLHRHEWARHGSCYGGSPEEYFADSIALIHQLNASPVKRLFAAHLGRRLDADAIRAAFDDGFGRGAGARVLVDCAEDDGRRIVAELRINLEGTITPASNLGALIRAADPAPRGCPAAIVDRRGDQ